MTSKELLHLLGDIDATYIEEAAGAKKCKPLAFPHIAQIAVAACLLLAVGLSAASLSSLLGGAHGKTVPQIPSVAAGSPTPGGRKILCYDGARYAFLGDGAQYDFSALPLTNALGTLTQDSADASSDALSASFAVGGTLYEIPGTSTQFRVAVEFEGAYYIAEAVTGADGAPLDAAAFFESANLQGRVQKAEILDHMGLQMLREISTADAKGMVQSLTEMQPSRLTDTDYEAIAGTQAQGASYQLRFVLDDGTSVDCYFAPSLGKLSLGDSWYDVPAAFAAPYGAHFDTLARVPPPMG